MNVKEVWDIIKYTYQKERKRNETLIGKGRALIGSNEAFQSCYNLLSRIFDNMELFEEIKEKEYKIYYEGSLKRVVNIEDIEEILGVSEGLDYD